MPRRAWVYICASLSRTLYIGVTSDLPRRIAQHRTRASGFTRRYRVDRLVYFEEAPDVRSAIVREKQLKRWARWKKLRLIEAANHGWLDLSRDWFTMWRRPDPSTSLGMTPWLPSTSAPPFLPETSTKLYRTVGSNRSSPHLESPCAPRSLSR